MKMTKTIVALALLFGCSAKTNAQIGGLLKKAKKAAKEAAEPYHVNIKSEVKMRS